MKPLLNLLLLVLCISNLPGQEDSPVKWSFEAQKISDLEYDVVFTATAGKGWYVYSQFLEEGGPIPTSFDFSEQPAIEPVGAAKEVGNKKEEFDKLFDMQVIKFSGATKFIQRIRLKSDISHITGFLTYMTCNDHSCLPPRDVNFKIALK